MPFLTTRRLAPLIAAGVLLAACGSSTETSSTTPTTEAAVATTQVDTEEIDSQTEPELADEPATDGEVSEPDPDVGSDAPDEDPSDGNTTDGNTTDEDTTDGEPPIDDDTTDIDNDPVEPLIDDVIDIDGTEPFVPAPGDAAFCAANAAFEDADQPEDDAEIALVAQSFIAELITIAPDDLRPDLLVFEDFIARVVAGQADFDGGQDEPMVEEAGERISEFIETRCEGDESSTSNTADPEPEPPTDVDLAAEPELPEGLSIPVVPISGDIREVNTPYFGEPADDGSPGVPRPGFVQDPLDADFCTAIDVINNRPQPTEDFEEIVVAQQYLQAIEPLVPTDIAQPYLVILAWLDVLVENGSFDGIDSPEPGSEIDTALEAVDAFVNQRCFGL